MAKVIIKDTSDITYTNTLSKHIILQNISVVLSLAFKAELSLNLFIFIHLFTLMYLI